MLTLKDAAKAIGVPYTSVINYHRRGQLPTVKTGRYELIDPAVLAAILNAAGYKPHKK